MSLVPLFLVSAAALGCEIALTRYFAVAKWSEYGYWVISIVMVGFALSGVVLALWRDALVRHGHRLLAVLPALLIVTGALGYYATTINPFNPLQLQNQATWVPQFGYIALYYASLLPFFFLAGLFVSLSFVLHPGRTGLVYAFDLTGAGAGAALVLALMFVVHPFHLVPALLPALALAVLFVPSRVSPGQSVPLRRWAIMLTTLLALIAAEALLLLDDQAQFNDFKPIYAPLHTPDARVLAERRSPRGDYLLLDDFTERVDTDVSNDSGMLGLPGPPRSFGLYRDGDRIASLPRPGPVDVGYAGAALDALPYQLIPGARVLLIGAGGGFRPAEALALGAAQVTVVDPEPALLDALRHGLAASPPLAADQRVRVSAAGPLALVRQVGRDDRQAGQQQDQQVDQPVAQHYDIIDIAADFLDAAEANATAFSVEALAANLAALTPNGLVSVPVSIRDFPTYADRALATARAALQAAGVEDPARHVVAYRSAWNVRILLSRTPWDPARIAAVRRFCDDRSFDVSWYPGIDVAAARGNLYNDLPSVSFAEGTTSETGPDDSIADEAGAMLDGEPTASRQAFDLRPITLDRPFFYAVLRLDQLGTILRRLEILPQPEIGGLVNLAVLAQAAVIALLVLLVPAVAPRRIRDRAVGMLRPIVYFPALGLGFLFIEIYLIGQASLWLHDRTSGFALVLTGMLVFSGLGSLLADHVRRSAWGAVMLAALVAIAWIACVLLGLRPLMLATLSLPWLARAALVLAVAAPVSLALGLPFPLGLSRLGGAGGADGGGAMLPWAWALNGAFSVVATPLANLIAREAGYDRVLFCAAVLYVLALTTFPTARKTVPWPEQALRSHAAD
jgi:SAM-dependent methyltransferase